MPVNQPRLTTSEVDALYKHLLDSELFQIYRQAFEQVTGQTMALIHPDVDASADSEAEHCSNEFCNLMLELDVCKDRCVEHTLDLTKTITQQARTASCEGQITTTLIPIHSKRGLVAYIRAGQVRMSHDQMSPDFFLKISEGLPPRVARSVLTSFHRSKVYNKGEYQAQLTLLGAFAIQLGDLASQQLSAPSSRGEEMIQSVKQFILSRLHEKLSLEVLAEHCQVTQTYLCKQFKKVTGLTLIEYINRHRIEQAKTLILEKEMRVIEIAYATGFQSLSQFNRSFQRYAGQSPTQFKNTQLANLP